MKLVEILARELEKWPDRHGANGISQDKSRALNRLDCDVDVNDAAKCLDYGTWPSRTWTRFSDIRPSQLAGDYKTAIVTREMWQAERERIAKPGKKANAEGWIRHRGGNAPVKDHQAIEYRMRSGQVMQTATGGMLNWRHGKWPSDIMAYRIHKATEQPVIEPTLVANVQAFNEQAEMHAPKIKVTHIDHEAGVIHAESVSSSCGPVKAEWSEIQDSCPLQWRDRIREIDRTVEALEEERVSLIQRIEDEGFKLIGVQSVDMSDCLKWKRGDKVMANEDGAGAGGGFHRGGIYVMREDCTNKDHSIKVVADDNGVENGWGSEFFTFHSRPSA